MLPKPNPHPGIALFGAAIGFFGFIAWQLPKEIPQVALLLRLLGAALMLLSAWLLVKFFYGLRLDLTVKRDGLLTQGRITRIQEVHGGKGRPDLWWLVEFQMTAADGTVHLTHFDEEKELRWKVGDPVTIRYHPSAPATIFRVV